MSAPVLTTDRLILRPAQPEDFEVFAAFHPSARAGARGWLMDRRHAYNHWCGRLGEWVMNGFGWLTLLRKEDKTPLGCAGLMHPPGQPEMEIGWSIWDDEAEGKGYAFEGARRPWLGLWRPRPVHARQLHSPGQHPLCRARRTARGKAGRVLDHTIRKKGDRFSTPELEWGRQMTPILETDRLILRRPVPGDWESYPMMSDRAAGVGGPHDLGKSWRAFASVLGHWVIHGHGLWAVTLKGDDTVVAMVGPWVPADWPEPEIGWLVLAAGHEGTGVATEAARAAIAHAWDVLKWVSVVSYISHDNTRSAALAKKLGAKLDTDAPQPVPDKPCLVYRHPRPEIVQ